jgi:hypothetical protein
MTFGDDNNNDDDDDDDDDEYYSTLFLLFVIQASNSLVNCNISLIFTETNLRS